MKKISDIRIFKSLKPNVDRAPLPVGLASKQLFTTVRRIVLKLRENQFSLGVFDHLYLNFTTRVEEGEIILSSRTAPGGNNFFRFYNIGVSREQFDILEEPDQIPFILGKLEETMVRFFGDDGREEIIRGSIRTAVEQGEECRCFTKRRRPRGVLRSFLCGSWTAENISRCSAFMIKKIICFSRRTSILCGT
ncbi:MAG: hypothetical protein IKD85_05690 [Firmicutes bacterium]|nr:hypothetical protein [Bacillota bacterium]